MSDSVWPHGLQPTRLLCSWDFPGKSTGVGCHCLFPIVLDHTLISHHYNYNINTFLCNKSFDTEITLKLLGGVRLCILFLSCLPLQPQNSEMHAGNVRTLVGFLHFYLDSRFEFCLFGQLILTILLLVSFFLSVIVLVNIKIFHDCWNLSS